MPQVRIVSTTLRSCRSCLESLLRSGVRSLRSFSGPWVYAHINLVLHDRNDPTPDRGSQLPRAASLIISSLGFIHDLRKGLLDPDTVKKTPLDMDQYTRLFGTARIPTQVSDVGQGCVWYRSLPLAARMSYGDKFGGSAYCGLAPRAVL
jgi:hypothetical protein